MIPHPWLALANLALIASLAWEVRRLRKRVRELESENRKRKLRTR